MNPSWQEAVESMPEGSSTRRTEPDIFSALLGARLIRELPGHAAVGHLRLNVNDLVQGDQIVLEGVEASEATELAGALQRAVDAANRAGVDTPNQPGNVTQGEADSIARDIAVRQP